MVMNPSLPALRGLALAMFAALTGAASAGQVNPDLAAAAQRAGRTEALIVLKDQRTPATAQLASGGADDYKARRRALVGALQDRAQSQQRGLRAWLDARGIEHRAFWITNMVVAKLSADELAALAARDEVSRIEPNPSIAVVLPQRGAELAPTEVTTVATGVDKIKAPLVWAAGITGQGVVIAGQDTGYAWQHPALKQQYRGWNGTTADHNYSWHDAIHSANSSCPANSPQPCDDNGHGTHTAGTFAGDDHATHQIGVAPGA
jgi:serine protease AprX